MNISEEISLPKDKVRINVTIEEILLFKVLFAPTTQGYVIKLPIKGVKAHQTIYIEDGIFKTHLTDEEKKIHLYHREYPLDTILTKLNKIRCSLS